LSQKLTGNGAPRRSHARDTPLPPDRYHPVPAGRATLAITHSHHDQDSAAAPQDAAGQPEHVLLNGIGPDTPYITYDRLNLVEKTSLEYLHDHFRLPRVNQLRAFPGGNADLEPDH
jgi:hypothetical protein